MSVHFNLISAVQNKETANRNTYYVYAKYVQPVAGAAVKSAKIIAHMGLNVREGASLSSKILGALPYGAVVEVIEVFGDWDKIIYSGGYGYVFAKYAA